MASPLSARALPVIHPHMDTQATLRAGHDVSLASLDILDTRRARAATLPLGPSC